ncbi:hypothetical protein SDC9_152722 [bioreactor metagenome]|uniref:Secretion system C-terminal sorting domain-containing protein n=1 Tax=bioreactor metagenome TaxID=1076179 RepID=A0A645ETW0_9ZZZZ
MIIPVDVTLTHVKNQVSGSIIDYPINISIPANIDPFYTFENAGITEFSLVLKTKKDALNVTNVRGAWTYTVTPTYTDDDMSVKITGKGNAITSAGVLCTPVIELLTPKTDSISVVIETVSFVSRDACVNPSVADGSVTYEYCAQPYRALNISKDKFYIEPVNPNPYTGSTLSVTYSIGFDASTNLYIYNSTGELVKTIFEGDQRGGVHTSSVDISNLGSGSYSIIMKSGPFENKQSLIILR